MTSDPLAVRLRETLAAAHHRARRSMFTPPVSARLLDEVAAGLAPVLRDLVAAAVAEQAEARR